MKLLKAIFALFLSVNYLYSVQPLNSADRDYLLKSCAKTQTFIEAAVAHKVINQDERSYLVKNYVNNDLLSKQELSQLFGNKRDAIRALLEDQIKGGMSHAIHAQAMAPVMLEIVELGQKPKSPKKTTQVLSEDSDVLDGFDPLANESFPASVHGKSANSSFNLHAEDLIEACYLVFSIKR